MRKASAISQLAEACRTRYGDNDSGCAHGIGHGIMEYLDNELVEGLELCKLTDQKNPLFGCTSGVFMEYNNSTQFQGDVAHSSLRKADPNNLQAPCDTLMSENFRMSCYFEIGLWWKDVLGNDYAKVGNLCLAAPDFASRDACFKGWGTVVAENIDYKASGAQKICGLIRLAGGASLCELGVAMRFSSDGLHANVAREICASLPSDIASECVGASSLSIPGSR